MMPAPAPVTTIQPSCTIRRPNSWAASAADSTRAVRAEPNTVTFRVSRYGAQTLYPYRSSLSAVLVTLRSLTGVPSSCIFSTVVSSCWK